MGDSIMPHKFTIVAGKESHRHGSPHDRGSADSYYGRRPIPHYFVGGTYNSNKIDKFDMTPEEIAEYFEGYEENEKSGLKKGW